MDNSKKTNGKAAGGSVKKRELTPAQMEARIKKRRKRRISRQFGLALAAIQIIVAIVLFVLLFRLNVLPTKYLIIAIVIISLISLYNVISQLTKVRLPGKIISVLLTVIMFVGCIYMNKTISVLDVLTGQKIETHTFDIMVLSSDSATQMSDLKDYTFGYVSGIDDDNINNTINQIKTDIGGKEPATTKYNTWKDLQDALYNQKVKAIILNDSFNSTMKGLDSDFTTKTKVIKTYSVEKTIELVDNKKDVSVDPFILYIAGNDEEGTIASAGRNDVNILGIVNPKTKQILLISTPRDSYIPVTDATGTVANDKLTHAGMYGTDHSIKALEDLYELKVDYYIKTNFTGAVGIVDALGGVTIDSEVAFTTTPDTNPWPITFVVGENTCDGDETLAFARERHAFAAGDFQRGRNQMIAINAIFNKATSPTIITNYMAVLDSMKDFFVTDMPSSKITSLVKGILDDPSPWNIQSFAPDQDTDKLAALGYAYCPLEKMNLSVVYLQDSSVKIGQELVNKIEAGEIFDVEEYVLSQDANSRIATPSATLKAN